MLFTFIPLQIGLGEENPPMFLYVSDITCHAFYIFIVATSLIGLASKTSQRCQKNSAKQLVSEKCRVVVLNDAWKEEIEPLIGDCQAIQ